MEKATPLQYLKEIIEKDVFIKGGERVITSPNSAEELKWIFDFRQIILRPKILDIYSEIFFEMHKDQYPFQVAGLETASIPLISAIVMKSIQKGIPVNGFFIRKSRKKSGLLNRVEGNINNEKIIIVDDVMNTGGSIMRVVEVLEQLTNEGLVTAKIVEVFTILKYRDDNQYTYFHMKGIKVKSLFELNDFSNSLHVSNFLVKEKKIIPNNFDILWNFASPKPNYFYVVPKSAPLYSDGKVFFGTDSGNFICLDSLTGKPRWKYLVPFGAERKLIFSSPCIDSTGTVYFGAYDGNLYALDAETGKRKWVFMEADWIGSSPCVSEKLGQVYVGLEFGLFKKRGGVVAVDRKTGEKVWEYRSEALTHGSPAYSEKYNVVCCGSNDKIMHVLNAKTGKLIWKFETICEIKHAPLIDEKRGLIIFGGIGWGIDNEEKSKIYVCDIRSGKLKYTYDEINFGIYSIPIIFNDLVIITSIDKCVHAFNINNGKQVWKFNTGTRIFSSPVIIRWGENVDRLYVGSNNGRLYELDPLTGVATSITIVTERITNKVAYDKERKIVFLPTFANEIYALARKKSHGKDD